MVSYAAFLLFTAAERGCELLLSRRNLRRVLARGGREVAGEHFPAMAALHAAFLPACLLEARARPFPGALGWAALGAALGAQALRWWAVATLGDRWNVRVVVEDRAPVTAGPYRFVRHPNYLAVVVELVAIPLVHGAWMTALCASALNAFVLRARIRAEERALGPRYAAAFADKPRLVPHG